MPLTGSTSEAHLAQDLAAAYDGALALTADEVAAIERGGVKSMPPPRGDGGDRSGAPPPFPRLPGGAGMREKLELARQQMAETRAASGGPERPPGLPLRLPPEFPKLPLPDGGVGNAVEFQSAPAAAGEFHVPPAPRAKLRAADRGTSVHSVGAADGHASTFRLTPSLKEALRSVDKEMASKAADMAEGW